MTKPFWNTRLTIIFLIIGALLSIPFIAMQFTNEVSWTLFDFAAAGTLLTGTVIACELVIRRVKKTRYRIAICAIILIILVVVWIDLAVGIFGTALSGS
jgi:peptidoglycan/LPS O-acetylase OafA/YrhL